MLQQYISKGATLTLKAKLFLAPVFLVSRLSEQLLRVCRQAGVSCDACMLTLRYATG